MSPIAVVFALGGGALLLLLLIPYVRLRIEARRTIKDLQRRSRDR